MKVSDRLKSVAVEVEELQKDVMDYEQHPTVRWRRCGASKTAILRNLVSIRQKLMQISWDIQTP